ncbi:MAG: hypothetical protein K6F85_03415 [Bacteroidales bacterium]|nr:hypothetical protein [Bacteroidales bacterium]
MLEFLKEHRRRRLLRQLKSVKRAKRIVNINDIKNIGVIFILGDESHWNILNHFARAMEHDGKRVKMIGLQPRNLELNYVITHRETYICHEKEDLDFWGVPRDEAISDFVDEHYDLLIDTTSDENFFSQYIALKTLADLKTVYAETTDEASELYDLIIRGKGQLELKGFFNNIVNYLGKIKK